MKNIFYAFFDSCRVNDKEEKIVFIGKDKIGSIILFPTDTNPFIEDYGYVRVYNNGELFCDENLGKLIMYTDSYNEFMEFCLDLWRNKTNQKIYPNCLILSSGTLEKMDERIAYRDSEPKNYLVP